MASLLMAGLLGLLVLCSAPAAAQSRPPDPRSDARLHVGPFYLTPSVTLKELGIDTNVFNEVKEPKKDFTFTVAPHLEVWVPFARRARVRVTAGADLVYYHRYETERSVNPQVGVRGEALFNRVTVFAEPTYLRTRVRPSFEIDTRSERAERGVAFGTEITALPHLSVALTGSTLDTGFADELFLGTSLREALNRRSRSARAVVRWAATPLTTFALRADLLEDRFPYSPVRDNDSIRIMPGVELEPRALVSGSAYVGIRRSRTLDRAMPAFDGVVASARLRYTLAGSTRLELQANRDINYSIELLQPYYITSGYGVSLSRHLGGRFDVTVGTEQYHHRYRHLAAAGAPVLEAPAREPDRSDRIRSYSGSIGYRVARTGRIGFGGTYWGRESNAQHLHNYDGLRLGTSITFEF
ncbi:MAG: outer membrane beta-barrel protein [Vicinamibacterales bacterium]